MKGSRIATVLIATFVATCVQLGAGSDELVRVPPNSGLEVECNDMMPCTALHENCKNGHCKCKPGHIRNKQHCFPERNYGETCFFDVQCTIHPMICSNQTQEVKICDCHKFYTWNAELKTCVHAENLSSMVSDLEETKFSAERIAQEARHIFPGVVTAGMIVLVLGALFASFCTVYGCFWDKHKFCCQHTVQDDKGEELVEVGVEEEQTTPAVNKPSTSTKEPQNTPA